MLTSKLRRHQDATLPLEEALGDLRREVLRAVPPEHGRITTFGQLLHLPERPRLTKAYRADDQAQGVVDGCLAGEEAAEQLIIPSPADFVVDHERRMPPTTRRVLSTGDRPPRSRRRDVQSGGQHLDRLCELGMPPYDPPRD